MAAMLPSIQLGAGRDHPVRQGHPWIFASAVKEVQGNPQPGETVEISSSDGEFLGLGAYSPSSKIRVRMWTWGSRAAVGPEFLHDRISKSISLRAHLERDPSITGYREIYAESDLLPGLIVDRYGDFRVLQFLSAGAEYYRDAILDSLRSRGDCEGIYERSDTESRSLEGLPERVGLLWGEKPQPPFEILENGMRFPVDVEKGHKTGFYLDQRDNRGAIRRFFEGGEVLDCFCYTGSFSAVCLQSGAASVCAIDSSALSLSMAERTIALNDLPEDQFISHQGDAFAELRRFRDSRRVFDVIILDPPRFAPTSSHVSRASRGYKDINLLAFKLLRPGGMLFTFSCSGGVSPELFQKIVAGAARDAGVNAQVIYHLGQPEDHPVHLNFPEARYLKGLICRVLHE